MTGKKKKPVLGRPLIYDENYHPAKVLELSKDPISLANVAVELDVHVDTLHDWSKKYPIFSEALKSYRMRLEDKMIKFGHEMMKNSKDKSAPTWVFMMKNMCKWKDKDDSEYKAEAEAQAQAQVKYSKALTREERIALARRKK
jgi:hypothetical protein